MAVNFLPYTRFKAKIPSTDEPASGYLLFTYEAGTSTKTTTYQDSAKASNHTNPIVLDANGEAEIWFDGTIKLALAIPTESDPPSSTVWTMDNVASSQDITVSGNYNLAQNGSFETDANSDGDPDSWTIALFSGGSSLLDTTTQVHGAQSLKFTSAGTGGGTATSSAYFEVHASKVVGVDFSIKSSVADVRNIVQIKWYDSTKTLVSTSTLYDDSATNPTSWTRKYTTVTAPATGVFAKLVLTGCSDADVTAGSTWFDDVVVYSADVYDLTVNNDLVVTGGTQLGSPTGGDKGNGTLNAASGIYVNNNPVLPLVQRVEATPYTSYSGAITSAIARDNSIPQNTEGVEILTVTITPKKTTNRLKIELDIPVVELYAGAGGGSSGIVAALFQDTTANAIAVAHSSQTSMAAGEFTDAVIHLKHEMAAGTTSATTFKIRVGLSVGAGAIYINGGSLGTALFNGVCAARLSVEEIGT